MDLGIGYKNKNVCAEFIKYIAQAQMEQQRPTRMSTLSQLSPA